MLEFRNINVSSEEPVINWGVEGILTALEIGDVYDWKKVIDAARTNDRVMQNLLQAVECGENGELINNIAPIILSLAKNN